MSGSWTKGCKITIETSYEGAPMRISLNELGNLYLEVHKEGTWKPTGDIPYGLLRRVLSLLPESQADWDPFYED